VIRSIISINYDESMATSKVICGACGKEFKTNAGYLKHKCGKTGFTPTQVEHFDALSGGRFSLQSQAALKRGAERKAKAEKKVKKQPFTKI